MNHQLRSDHQETMDERPPPPPGRVQAQKPGKSGRPEVTSLDFERVVNQYSIQAIRDRMLERVDQKDHDDSENDEQALLSSDGDEQGSAWYSTFSRSEPRYRYKEKQNIFGYTGRKYTRWLLVLLVGLLMGLTATVLVRCTEFITDWRSNQLDRLWAENNTSRKRLCLFYTALNFVLAMISAVLCVFFSPQAAGSGIPEVKSYLNGVRVYRFSNMPLFIVKIVATVLSVSSGLVCGPEGPFIHIGAILGTSCTRFARILQASVQRMTCIPGTKNCMWSWVNIDLAHFATDAERRDFVSVGAAAGFAAAFGAPIGGLLFSLEEASSFFPHSLLLKTLSATAIATFCIAVQHGDLSRYSVISLQTFHSPDGNIFINRFAELPLYILTATAGGICGGIFVLCWKKMQLFKRYILQHISPSWKVWIQLGQVALLSILTSLVTFFLSMNTWTCKDIDVTDDIVRNKVDVFTEHEHQVLCGPAQVNEVAAILFGGRDQPIRAILTDPTQFDERTLLAVGLSFYPLMMLTLGVALPSGIFMPTILIGCSLGGYMGIQFQKLFLSDLSPSTFALLGAASLLAGIQRSTVSLCVILVEGTGQVKVLIPVIITVVIARYVGDLIIKEGLYEAAIELNHYPYLGHEERKRYDVFQVGHIMSPRPFCIGPKERAHTIAKILQETSHNGFPVVDKSVEGGKFLGLVRRDQLVALLECGVFMSDEDFENFDSVESSTKRPLRDWTPPPGVSKSPLMNLAYHIKDDRYQQIAEGSIENLDEVCDQEAWVKNLRKNVKNLDTEGLPLMIAEQVKINIRGVKGSQKTRFGWVGRNAGGQVAVRLNPKYSKEWVHVAAVMNRGTHTVTEFCPVSKAMRMFTALGLRHLIVLGGETGGRVVGIITRANLLPAHIESLYGVPSERLAERL